MPLASKKLVALYDQCPECHGTGKVVSRLPFRMRACERCGGKGFVRRLPGVAKDRDQEQVDL